MRSRGYPDADQSGQEEARVGAAEGMKGPAILVPFKGDSHKSRLSPVLGPSERTEFAYLLLDHVLAVLGRSGLGGRSYLISPDSRARTHAGSVGVSFIHEDEGTGVNGAVAIAVRRLRTVETFLVLPSDLALLSAADLKVALGFLPNRSFVIAPSLSFNGTNLLIFPRRMAPHLSYDDNSFWNHLDAAARLGLRTAVLTRKGVVFDIDTPADAEELVRLGINTRPARFIRKSLRK